MSYSSSSASSAPRTWAYAAGHRQVQHLLVPPRRRTAPSWARSTQSGWARTRSESTLTISGSTQSPKSRPSAWTRSISGCSPSGQTSGSTVQSPSPRRSSRRPRNQPSSSTNRSTPTSAAAAASSVSGLEVVVEVDRLPGVDQHLALTGPRRWCAARSRGSAPRRRRGRRPTRRRPARATCTLARGRASTSPGAEQLPAAEQALALRRPLGVRRVVAAPRDVDRPHLAGAEPEAGRAGARAAASRRGRCGRAGRPRCQVPTGHGCRCGTRSPIHRPVRSSSSAARRRHRQRAADRHDLQPVVAVVGHGGARADQPLGASAPARTVDGAPERRRRGR